MRWRQRLNDYTAHPDPLTSACNRIALLVAGNQPLYPLYVLWLVGGDWWVSGWTFLSTPFFAAIPAVARRNTLAGRAMLPLTGIANGMLSAKAFGTSSGVDLFLVPCVVIALLGFHRRERGATVMLLAVAALSLFLHGHYGAPLGRFTTVEYAHFRRINAYSVAGLSLAVLWLLSRARAGRAQP